ncbi:MAG: type II toxin-antitoxin system VapC family toxin [Trueperaceae bacterium]
MTIVDANVLLYAVNGGSPQHDRAKRWLDDALSGDGRVGLPWLSLLAFVRIATHPAVFPNPLPLDRAFAIVDGWTRRPNVVHPEPSRDFATTFGHALRSGGAHANLANDAYLAALAHEYGATVVTFDRDFDRFEGIATLVPPA